MTTDKVTNTEVKELGALISRCNDKQLDYLVKLLRARRNQAQNERALEALEAAEVGKQVRINNIKPQYLMGCRATILNIVGDKLHVELISPVPPRAMRRFGERIILPASCCTVID